MKKFSPIVPLTLFLVFQTYSQNTAENSSATQDIGFEYTVLPPKAGLSELITYGDTISFTLYFVDADCGGSTYSFTQNRQELVVTRLGEFCSGDEDYLYGVQGTLSNVPPGKYLFVLKTHNDKNRDVMFSEQVWVK